MASILRSEEMMLLQLLLQSDSAYACVRELGELGKVEFKDLNADVSAFQRKFVNELRRCDEMERILRFFVSELEKAGIVIPPAPAVCPAPDPHLMIDYETQFEQSENSIKQLNANQESLKKNLLDLKELKYILDKAQTFFQEGEQVLAEAYVQQQQAVTGGGGGGAPAAGAVGGAQAIEMKGTEIEAAAAAAETKFTFLIGVIPTENLLVFIRVLWRVCRGNVFVKHAQIDETLEDPVTGNPVVKSVFILFFQGEQLHTRIKKLCDGFRATLYACPETTPERQQVRLQVAARIEEVQSVLQNTTTVRNVALGKIAQSVEEWQQKVKKIKAIYHAMNMFNLDMGHQSLVAECWCPVKDFQAVQEALNRGTQQSGSPVSAIVNRISTPETPPTYYKVNKFTTGFQAIVEAYGVASYRELNPTPYAIITFPFLFGVMFGDMGHGLMMFLFALVLIAFEKKLAKTKEGGEFLSIVFSGRYLLLLMGLFSIYTGIIYNTLYSRAINVFGSGWRPYYYGVNRSTFLGSCTPSNASCYPELCNLVYCSHSTEKCRFPTEAQISNQPYPFGLDPMWLIATNKLTFSNSYKMKMSIILGLFQLLFGVVLSVLNHIKFKSYVSIIGESIPRFIFLINLIGWLVFLMFFKWCKYYPDATKAPNLLLTLIYMFLDFGNSPNIEGSPVYSVFGTGPVETAGQQYFQVILVITAVICIPWMLLVKPIYLIVKNKRTESLARNRAKRIGSEAKPMVGHASSEDSVLDRSDSDHSDHSDMSDAEKAELVAKDKDEASHGGHGGHGQRPGEIIVISSIHTIEYCLGTISNTASYLRLWALSLAHEQLSEVLWQYAIAKYNIAMFGSQSPYLGFIIMFALWAGWAVLTIGILLVLEGLSAFLHALRLHWIEFQGKFYEGEGRKFKPMSFAVILSGGEEDE